MNVGVYVVLHENVLNFYVITKNKGKEGIQIN